MEHRTIRVSSLRMTPVDLSYTPILLNEAFIKALWDMGAEKSFISEEVYRKYFSYRPRQKTKDRGAPYSHLVRVELQIRIREFQKTWEFHILNNMQYQCILGIDFIKESKFTLDFDQEKLFIPDNQIKQLQKMEKPVEIHLSDTKLGEGQKGLDPPYSIPIRVTDSFNAQENDLPPDSPEAYRFAIDYRKLNAITKYLRYPLPVIDDLITNIPCTGIMSTLDLKSGYFQLAISPKDIEKIAFITRNGTFAFLRMPFGLSGAAPNFQKAIDIILKPVVGSFVMVYMDDVIITSPSFNEHLDPLNQVFTLLRDAGLTLNKEKCHFARTKLKYLGLIIRMAGWYQKFLPHYADICEPLYRLKKKGAKFNWSTEAKDSFDKIKRALTEAPVLQLPNFTEQFYLFTDASGVGIGAVLNQNHRPIAFASRILNKAERNYTVTERECLAVIWVLNKFETYFGSLSVKVITDHAPLAKLTNGRNLSSRMIRWALKLT
ncbi:retrovirus-related Pol polyprotein from transposon 17.6 [Trichonephila clavipes]|uniref:RNA-directed DNA polymerase n=1 Tax=Trichonephila clavipes TaxID=2585209 RepID=A0A8X6V3X7_TRICX|nr:retrovirus-related Pol polyprotein from transposon 17.6 [Trichonephila clavipes]